MAKPNLLARPGRSVSLVDEEWQKDSLPFDDISVPADQMPDPDSESGPPPTTRTQETAKDSEKKWTDLALFQLLKNTRLK